MHAAEIDGTVTGQAELSRGQEVRVRLGSQDLGVGKVDDITDAGDMVWVVFKGPNGRRLFLDEDGAEFAVLAPW